MRTTAARQGTVEGIPGMVRGHVGNVFGRAAAAHPGGEAGDSDVWADGVILVDAELWVARLPLDRARVIPSVLVNTPNVVDRHVGDRDVEDPTNEGVVPHGRLREGPAKPPSDEHVDWAHDVRHRDVPERDVVDERAVHRDDADTGLARGGDGDVFEQKVGKVAKRLAPKLLCVSGC